jgi:hypothetical protein
MLRPDREEVRRKWRRLHGEEFKNLHPLKILLRLSQGQKRDGRAYSSHRRDTNCIQNFGL